MAEKTLEVQNTLVRYNNPTLVIKHEDRKSDKEVKLFIKLFETILEKLFVFQETPKSPKDGRPVSGAIGDSRKETEEILNSILPPRSWEGLSLFYCRSNTFEFEYFQRTANCGAKLSQARQQLDRMLSISRRCLILVSSKAKRVKLEFVQSDESFTANALTKSFVR